jgi:acetolactate synthase-1/2/3 large subunit
LRNASRPAILAGGDVIASGAMLALDRFARRLAAPVIETRVGKGSVPASHPLNAGNSRHRRAKAVLAEADLLIAVGTRFTQIDTSNWHMRMPPCLIQIDRDPAELGREFPIACGIAGDLAQSMDLLLQLIGDSRLSAGWGDRLPDILASQARPPVPVLSEIRQALPENGILASDITSLSYRAFDEFPVQGPRDFVYSCHYVTMGCGLPFALGAKIACPDRPVVALCGDGGILMSIGELATAAQYEIPVVIVVVVDQALLAIKASQIKNYGGRLIDTDLTVPDFVALAQSFGVAGHRANNRDHLRQLIAGALAANKPALVEVPMVHQAAEIMRQIPWLTGE